MVDAEHPSIRSEVRGSLWTWSPHGPWFHIVLTLALVAAAYLLIRLGPPTTGVWIRTVFATGGIGCMVIAWILSGREGDVGFVAQREVSQAPNMATGIPETRHDLEETGARFPWILVLVAYGIVLMLLAVLLPF